ncbi:MAG: hypothetical protein ACREOU_11485 [Candidatus Eiseniibacteriota bacterium]
MKALFVIAAVLALFHAQAADAAQTQALVYSTDFGSGVIGSVDLDPPRTGHSNRASVCADAALRCHQGLLYVVERFGCDNIRILDPAANFAVVQQFSVGNGSNPQDIIVVSPTKAYVSRYETAELWIVNPVTGVKTGEVSLAGFADADGIPEMAQMALRNGRLFVAVQRLDRDAFFTPTDSSQVVVIDAATDLLVDADLVAPGVQGILLPFQNPVTEIVTDGNGDLLVGCTGFFGSADGGVVRLDPIALAVRGVEIDEAELGGDLNDVVVGPGDRGFAVISDASFNTLCVAYDRTDGTLDAPVFATSGFNLADAEMNDRNELWLSDRSPGGPGMRVFDAVTLQQLTQSPIGLGLPPQSLDFDDVRPVAVGDPPVGSRGVSVVALLGISPNPSFGEASVRVRVSGAAAQPAFEADPSGGEIRLVVHVATGRRVREIRRPVDGPGDYVLRWNGDDDNGRATAPGVYPFRVLFGGEQVTGRLVRGPRARL